MSADNRTVATDALATLGTIIGDGEKRDAIHLAVVPMEAPERLHAGDHIDKDGNFVKEYSKTAVAIVDPFLTKEGVHPGEMFWAVIYPRVITSLRHVWTHPAFPDEPVAQAAIADVGSLSKQQSEDWLHRYCDEIGVDYDTLLTSVDRYYGDEYLTILGEDAYGAINPEMWVHLENVTGKKINGRASYFSCSC